MQLDEVREQLREIAARVPAGSVAADEVLGRARRTVKRRRVTLGIAALAAVVVIGTIAVVLNVSRPAPDVHVSVRPPSTTVYAPTSPMFTAAQLRAHLGVGVPSGWGPIDEGDARLWVPTFWDVGTRGTCYSGGVAHMVSLGKLAQAHCGTGPPPNSVSLIPTSQLQPGRLARVVHGYRVYESTAPARPGSHVYDVPALGVELAFRGSLSDRILGSLGPSARIVALAFANQPAPAGTRNVTTYGVNLSIPSSWPIGSGASCGLGQEPALTRVRNDGGLLSCPAPIRYVGARQGVALYPSDEFGKELAPPIVVLRHGNTSVSIYTVPDEGDQFEVRVHRDGSQRTHDLVLGLGRDGRIAGGILASIEATA